MAAFDIDGFKAALPSGGARANNYDVEVQVGPALTAIIGDGFARMPFLCKATNIPSGEISMIEVPYFGRMVKFAGDRTYAEWTTTVICREDFDIRNALELWQNAIDANRRQGAKRAIDNALGYSGTAYVRTYRQSAGQGGGSRRVPSRQYKFVNIWPSTVNEISLGHAENDTIIEFDVTWQYDYWEPIGEGTATTSFLVSP